MTLAPDDGLPLQPGAPAEPSPSSSAEVGPSAAAWRLSQRLEERRCDILYVAKGESRAEEVARSLRVFSPAAQVLMLPAWDCLPYDRVSPSREIMGRRMAVLAQLAEAVSGPRVLVTSDAALVQRLPPPDAVKDATFTLRVGMPVDREALAAFAARTGYTSDDRTDEPGELKVMGEVIDAFPPHLMQPVRARLDGDRIVDLETYDALTQRTLEPLTEITLGPASEWIDAGDSADFIREPGCEHRLAQAYPALQTVFDLLPDAAAVIERGAADRACAFIEQVEEAFRTQKGFSDAASAPAPSSLYLKGEELTAALNAIECLALDLSGLEPWARFAEQANPGRAFSQAVAQAQEGGRRVVLTGLAHELRSLERALERGLGIKTGRRLHWADAFTAEAVCSLTADLAEGFDDPDAGVAVITATDVLGSRVAARRSKTTPLLAEPDLRIGDVVIHEDHGVGVLRDLERVGEQDVLRLEYHGGAMLLSPVEEFGRIWRYGAEADAVTLDRLKGDGWNKRRAEVSRAITADAEVLVAKAKARAEERAQPIVPPKAAYARFAAGFVFPETPDQKDAIAAVLSDLASGRPMNRLVCGDVGFGKTEVALRAAAAVALSGRQVAIAAPTTVLARQHAQAFERRLAPFGVKVAQLSRLVEDTEAKAVKAGLASGEIRVVIGTHALASESVQFHDLALMILDEEQKFGAKLKASLTARAEHHLAMTATPIPRTLQAAMVGLQDVSVIASPPARRRPIRTFVAPFDEATLRTALLREKRRGGQSFVVAPRISDLDALADRLGAIVPELTIQIAHGERPPEEVDGVMVDFASGGGDVLLATNIIESGLDVPRANTMLVWRADRFGLAQLHQLRGRVGRGRTQGVAYLFTDAAEGISEATRARLATLEAFDRLGCGLSIAARDLDLRGGGDMVGEEQAGHMKMIGSALYHRLMEKAVRSASGQPADAEWTPELRVGSPGILPESYIPDVVTRINLYARLFRLRHAAEVEAFAEELDDRFGPLPAEAARLVDAARLQALAAAAGVKKISTGPRAVALDLSEQAQARASKLAAKTDCLTLKEGRIVLKEAGLAEQSTVLADILTLLAA